MSRFRALAGVLRGGRVGGGQWLRGCVGGPAGRYVKASRACSSGAVPVPAAVASSSSYVEEMYFAWLEDHNSVHKVTSDSTFDKDDFFLNDLFIYLFYFLDLINNPNNIQDLRAFNTHAS